MLNKRNKIKYLAKGILGIEYFTNFKPEHINGKVKFIQLNINDEDYLIISKQNHSEILHKTLRGFGLAYSTNEWVAPNGETIHIPNEKSTYYELIGAGRVAFVESSDKLNFYWRSSRYPKKLTNRKNLENIFKKENVLEFESDNWPLFRINYDFGADDE
jgi:hypothetical protein